MKTRSLFLLGLLCVSLGGCVQTPQATPSQQPQQPAVLPPPAGTPVSGGPGGVAYYGTMPFAPSAAGVTVAVDAVEITRNLMPPGYVFVAVGVRVVNESNFPVNVYQFTIVDDFSNCYAWWRASRTGRPDLPLVIEPHQVETGFLGYNVPEAALPIRLRLRWESQEHRARLEIFLPVELMTWREQP